MLTIPNVNVKNISGMLLMLTLQLHGKCAAPVQSDRYLRSIQLIVHYPVILGKGKEVKLFDLRDTIRIVYFKNKILYQLPMSRNVETDMQIKGTEKYFLQKKGDYYGELYTGITGAVKGIRLAADSFLQKKAFAGTKFENGTNDTLVGFIQNKDGHFSLEKYTPKLKSNEDVFDSIYFYFSPIQKGIPYSLSPLLDSLRNSKLVKARFLYNESFSKKYAKALPRREFSFEIREEELPNLKQIIAFMNKH